MLKNKTLLKAVTAGFILLLFLHSPIIAIELPSMLPSSKGKMSVAPKPNFIVIFCDDMGYSDIGCFGADKNHRPDGRGGNAF